MMIFNKLLWKLILFENLFNKNITNITKENDSFLSVFSFYFFKFF